MAEATAAGPAQVAAIAALGRRRADGTREALPPCAHCLARGAIVAGLVVDHIQPHRGDPFLLRLSDNLQPLCQTCHAVKGPRENGTAPCPHAIAVSVLGRVVCAQCGRAIGEGGIPPVWNQETARQTSRVRVQVSRRPPEAIAPPETLAREAARGT